VRPKVVVTLGERAYVAVRDEFRLWPRQAFGKAVRSEPVELLPGTFLAPVYHCGARVLNTHRQPDQQRLDWTRVQDVLLGEAASSPGVESSTKQPTRDA
jgi:hypothetical protein